MGTVGQRTKKRTAMRIGPGTAGIRMTGAEFDAITNCNENYRYELLRGVLIVSPIPLAQEGGPNELLAHLLLTHQEQHPLGGVLDFTLSERYVYIDEENRRRADRLIWCGLGRLPDVDVDPPSIVIEFVSKAKRDYVRDYQEKRAEYMGLSIPEYWLFDRFRRIATIFRPDGSETVVKEGDLLRSPILPGFELDVRRLFALADNLPHRRR